MATCTHHAQMTELRTVHTTGTASVTQLVDAQRMEISELKTMPSQLMKTVGE